MSRGSGTLGRASPPPGAPAGGKPQEVLAPLPPPVQVSRAGLAGRGGRKHQEPLL